jgi:hypothetical protein
MQSSKAVYLVAEVCHTLHCLMLCAVSKTWNYSANTWMRCRQVI